MSDPAKGFGMMEAASGGLLEMWAYPAKAVSVVELEKVLVAAGVKVVQIDKKGNRIKLA